MPEWMPRLQKHRTKVVSAFDAAVWVLAFLIWVAVRLEGEVTTDYWLAALALGVVAAVLHLLLGLTVRLHHGRSKLASLEEAVLLAAVTLSVGALIFVANLGPGWIPRSIPAGAMSVVASWLSCSSTVLPSSSLRHPWGLALNSRAQLWWRGRSFAD